MPELKITVQYDPALLRLDQHVQDVIDVFRGQLLSIVKDAVINRTPVDVTSKRGKKKGFGEHLQDQWKYNLLSAGKAEVSTDVVYGPVLEYGRYPGVGPRTVSTGTGIFSRQAAGGIIQPLLDDSSILGDAVKTAINQISQSLSAFR